MKKIVSGRVDGSNDGMKCCKHEMTFRSLCMSCGAKITDKKSNSKKNKEINLDWMLGACSASFKGLRASSHSAIRELYINDYKTLLATKKLRLVLDFDETLIHTIQTPLPPKLTCSFEHQMCNDVMELEGNVVSEDDHYSFVDLGKPQQGLDISEEAEYVSFVMGRFHFKVYIRPGLRDFLRSMSAIFDIYLYTNGTDKYARTILAHLFASTDDSLLIKGIFARQSSSSPRSLKQLHKMLCKRAVSVIVDDRLDVWCNDDAKNVLQILPFLGSAKDTQLPSLGNYLRRIHSCFFTKQKQQEELVDVREVLSYFAQEEQEVSDSDEEEMEECDGSFLAASQTIFEYRQQTHYFQFSSGEF